MISIHCNKISANVFTQNVCVLESVIHYRGMQTLGIAQPSLVPRCLGSTWERGYAQPYSSGH